MKTFTEIPAVDLHQINSYLDNYEILLDRKGYALSDLKILSQKRREEIFLEIETSVEKSQEYNLQRILESFASKPISTSLRAEENEVIFKVRIPPYLRLFPLGLPKLNISNFSFPKRNRTREIPKRPISIKPVRRVKSILDPSEKMTEPEPSQKVNTEETVRVPLKITASPDSEFYYKLNVDVEKAREYVEKSYRKTNKLLNIVTILSTLITAGIVIGIGIIQYLYTFNRDQYFSCYFKSDYDRYFCYFLDYIYIRDIEDILMITLIIYASIIGFYIFMKMIIGLIKWFMRQEIGKIIIKCQIPMVEREVDKLGGTIKRFFYEGIITSEILEA